MYTNELNTKAGHVSSTFHNILYQNYEKIFLTTFQDIHKKNQMATQTRTNVSYA